MKKTPKVLTQHFEVKEMHTLKVAKKHGRYECLKKLFSMKPEEVIEEVKASGIRGRGGAGFPAGLKWSFVPKDSKKPKYLVVNADESEPGTFKDRALLEKDPHMLLEGIIIAAYAIGANRAYVYFRGEFAAQYDLFWNAIEEAKKAKLLGDDVDGSGFKLEVVAHRGAGAYICGEETALLSSLEGYRGQPRIKPPFPAVEGLWASPTVVNNVETIAALPWILNNGAKAYAAMGTEKSPSTKLFSVCGHVEKPGVYEVELGTPFKDLLAMCGGVWKGRNLKAVVMGGSSVPVVTAEEAMNAKLDYESLQQAGTLLGSGGMIIFDDSICAVEMMTDIARFYNHESCGQCTPCREGTGWVKKICDRIEKGDGRDGDLELLLSQANNMSGRTICTFADALAMPVRSWIAKFRHEFEEHIKLGYCPHKMKTPTWQPPKVVREVQPEKGN